MGDGPGVALYGESDSAGPVILCASTPSHTAAASRADDVPWFWRIAGLAPAAGCVLLSRRDEHVGACARTANSTEPTVGVGLLLIPSTV